MLNYLVYETSQLLTQVERLNEAVKSKDLPQDKINDLKFAIELSTKYAVKACESIHIY